MTAGGDRRPSSSWRLALGRLGPCHRTVRRRILCKTGRKAQGVHGVNGIDIRVAVDVGGTTAVLGLVEAGDYPQCEEGIGG